MDEYTDAMEFNVFMAQYAKTYLTLEGVEAAWARRVRIDRPFVTDAERIHRMLTEEASNQDAGEP